MNTTLTWDQFEAIRWAGLFIASGLGLYIIATVAQARGARMTARVIATVFLVFGVAFAYSLYFSPACGDDVWWVWQFFGDCYALG